MKVLIGVLAFVLGAMCAYGLHKYRTRFPYPLDGGRLASYPGKVRVDCPSHPDYVLLILGQSNAANSGGQRYVGREGVINYYNGCYQAASPLLGASGVSGEPWTLLGNHLTGTVVLVPFAVGSTAVKQWAGPLGDRVESLLQSLPWPPTHILWHQGEEDYALGTTDYRERFQALLVKIRRHTQAPVFVFVATRCGLNWRADNAIAQAQAELATLPGVFPGPNTDTLMDSLDRFEDCHFSASGLEKFARAWLGLIHGL